MTHDAAEEDGFAKPRGAEVNAAVSRELYAEWVTTTSAAEEPSILRRMRVPGDVALRGRFHLLADRSTLDFPDSAFDVTWEVWEQQIALARTLDAALVRNDLDAAHKAAAQLIESNDEGHVPLPRIDALIGRGDAARQADKLEQAILDLDTAAKESAECGYRFGEARALVSLGYVTMIVRSARDAVAAFARAETICRQLDERMYLANALIGGGEALGRLRNNHEAIRALEEGLELSQSISSISGAMNASQHLGDLHRRLKDPDAARAYFAHALALAEESSTHIAIVNAADGLGEIALANNVTEAEEFYKRALHAADTVGYRRGIAHARNGLGRAAFRRGDYEEAEAAHVAAYELFNRLNDLASATSALDGMARVAAAANDLQLSASCRLAAVGSIEQLRSAQDRNDAQLEYAERFDAVYANALRAALLAELPHAFVACFEGIAGRRLAGLVDSLPAQLAENAHFLSSLSMHAHRSRPDQTKPRAERLTRLLGASALRGTLPSLAENAVDDLTAALYRPFDPSNAADLLEGVAACTDVLLICEMPDDPSVLAWLRTTHHGANVALGSHGLTERTISCINDLAEKGLDANATPDSLDALSDLLPDAALSTGTHGGLTIIPLGALWAVPWPAVPVGASVLGARTALAISPSLSLADHAMGSQYRSIKTVGYWRSPLIRNHHLEALGLADERVATELLPSAEAALDALIDSRHDAVIVAGHGKPAPGIGHYLELNHDVALEPTSLLAATPPDILILLACWGANHPGRTRGDPLTLATLALARGATQVGATTSELLDDRLASRFINNVLHHLPNTPLPDAIRAETERFLTNERARMGPLSRWAPLVTVGLARSRS